MYAFNIAWLAAAAISFFCESLALTPLGVPGALVLAALAALLPELLNRIVVPIFFRPDMTIVVDPSACDARIVAQGIRQAMRICLAEDRLFSLLISRVPGSVVTIGLNAVRQRVFVTIGCEADAALEMKSQSALPAFLPGEAATWYRLTGGGDNVRLHFRPADSLDAGVFCETPVLGWQVMAASGALLLAIVWAWAGAWVAGVVVFPFVVIRTLANRQSSILHAMQTKPVFVVLGSLSVIVFNLLRMNMF